MFKKTVSNTKLAPRADGVTGNTLRESVKKMSLTLLVLIAIGGVVTSLYFFRQYTLLKNNPDMVAQKETARIIASLGKMIELPSDEVPTMATITDKEKLKDQLFFRKTENGDIVLAYNQALQAILYRPTSNKIIAVAPIVLTPEEQAKRDKTLAAIPVLLKVAYYNGTETVGFSGQLEQKVVSKYPTYQTGVVANAARKDFKEILVIDVSGKNAEKTKDIAVLLGGKVGSLPEGEARPEADILVIAGK
jgi:hypothetical protein